MLSLVLSENSSSDIQTVKGAREKEREMGKTGRWIRNLLTGKKEKERGSKERENDHQISANDHPPTTPISIPQPTTPKEKRRWSFRRSSATAPPKHDSTPTDHIHDHPTQNDPALPTTADAPAPVVMQITPAGDEAAATKIQAVFRAYLVSVFRLYITTIKFEILKLINDYLKKK